MKRIIKIIVYVFEICLCISGLHAQSNDYTYVEKSRNGTPTLKFDRLLSVENLPSEEVTQVLQDKNDYLWFATNAGLCRYDGYGLQVYKNNEKFPSLLTSSAVKCIAEDTVLNRIYIGTSNGLNMLNRETGKISKLNEDVFRNKTVYTLSISSDGSLWVGLDADLYRYFPDRDSFAYYKYESDGRSLNGVKAILEDHNGYIWFGTWSNGLFRYDRKTEKIVPYPMLGESQSVHTLLEDSQHRLWAGTWGYGLFCLTDYETPEAMKWVQYRKNTQDKNSLSGDIVYCLEEDMDNGLLWVGTRNGLSIMDIKKGSKNFNNYLPEDKEQPLPYNELNSIVRDRTGRMWLGMMGGGVYSVSVRKLPFYGSALESVKQKLFSNSVRSIFVDSDNTLWMGIGSLGLVVQPLGEQEPRLGSDYFGQTSPLSSINHIIERKDKKEIWFASWGNGVYVYDKTSNRKSMRIISPQENAWMINGLVVTMLEDKQRNIWLGGMGGIMVYRSDDTGINLSDSHSNKDSISLENKYTSICETADGYIWLGCDKGIIRVSGDVYMPDSLKYTMYSVLLNNLPYDNVQCMLEDTHGRLWVGSEGGGLSLYDKKTNRFEAVNELFGLALVDAIYSMEEDKNGDLWMGTNTGLVKLTVHGETFSSDDNVANATFIIYTKADGLLNDIFHLHASCKDSRGRLYFGGHDGYNFFDPDILKGTDIYPQIAITDISVFNTPIDGLSEETRNKISTLNFDFMREMRLNHNQNNFSIEFSSLSYANPSKNRYAYKLDGFDKEWQYVGALHRIASYNSLPAGTYVFHVRGTNASGLWSLNERTLTIIIEPAPWNTWWAYLCYAVFVLIVGYLILRYVRERMREKDKERMYEMELSKAEEINHAKLQFFTNVTHEFLTPLTILSASVDELKSEFPQNKTMYSGMSANINRLIRLIQQILEFRKAETGNLKLRVSEGNLTDFVRSEVESFAPLMRKKQMHFSFSSTPDDILGYFDSDKLDKILYNLLSNVSKYNKDGGHVNVSLSCDDSKIVTILVKDDGPGLSSDTQKHLFERFYEGDHRQYNTIGNGIGLSLVRDLVLLHRGSINVESEVGKGTTFFVKIPLSYTSYLEGQVDDMASAFISPVVAGKNNESIINESAEENEHNEPRTETTLLIVEDNEDLLSLMVKLLGHDYLILTAHNGVEALKIVEQSDIDLIVSDVMMPEMDGIELCRNIKQTFDYSHIPVILLTAKNTEEDRIDAYESGADGFLGKPFNLSLLHARIRNLLKRKERTAHDFKKQLVFEAKELDYTSLDEDFLQRAIDCVQKHLADADFDQPQFIEEMATSKTTLYKKLKSLTGFTTSSFIRNIRMKAACRIMEEKPGVRISELAYAVGFSDPKYFSTCFKKDFGMLPTDYIEKYGKNPKDVK